ncbi:MAG: sensor domain-containing diguanylate cyclase [Acidimicrobiales bacterium]
MKTPEEDLTGGADIGAGGELPNGHLWAHLTPFLREAVELVDPDGTVRARLAPPGGLLGHPEPRVGGSVFDYLHPDDLPKALELGQAMSGAEPGWEGRWTIRLRRPDDSYGQFEVTVCNRIDDPVLHGLVVHTRELPAPGGESLPEGLELAEAMAASVAEAVPAALAVLDQFGRIRFANRSTATLVGAEPSRLKGRRLIDVATSSSRDELVAALRELGRGPGSRTVSFEIPARWAQRRADPTHRRVQAALTASGLPGRTSTIFAVLEDVTDRHRTESELRRQATEDHLTGLPNRAAILEVLDSRLAHGTGSSVVYCDLDGFKAINDALGHQRGDEVLVAFAGYLRSVVRPGDFVGRIGGDEFLIVTDRLDAKAESDLVTRIRRGLAAGSWGELGLRPSIGVANAEPGERVSDLVHRADQAMYRDKQGSPGSAGRPALAPTAVAKRLRLPLGS